MTRGSVAEQDRRSARRSERYAAREALWSSSSLKRVRYCGRYAAATQHDALAGGQVRREPTVAVRVTGSGEDARAGFSGVQSCGSTWACPVCSEKIQAHRQSEVQRALEEARRRGWVVGFFTFTVRHSRAHSLAGVWGAVSTAWRAATSGSRSAWASDRAAFGVRGYVRLLEVTHGDKGWHVHVHALVFLDPAGTVVGGEHYVPTVDLGSPRARDAAVQALGSSMADRWRGALTGTGFRPSRRHGHDSRLVTADAALPEYFAKNLYSVKSVESAAHDVTSSHGKQARHGNVTPFGILARIVNAPEVIDTATGELVRDVSSRDLALWREWEAGSKGKRQLLWSNGLRAELGLDDELEDTAVVDQAQLDGRILVEVTAPAYRRLAARGLLARVLDLAERDDDGQGLAGLLAVHGVPWVLPPPQRESA